jgi:hypothetical protein
MERKLVAEGLVTFDSEGPRLMGGRRRSDGAIVFPMPQGSEAAYYAPFGLSREGRLWSFTVQRFQPKPPYRGPPEASFTPYAVGYVEIPGEIIVEARLDAEPGELQLGMPMAITLLPAFRDAAGDEVFTYAFRPIQSQTRPAQ